MENQDSSNNNRRTLRRNSNSHISMSDTESTASQVDSWHSPLRFDSPLRSDDPIFLPENDNCGNKSSKSLVPTERFHSQVPSPGKSNFKATSPAAAVAKGWRPWPHSVKSPSGNGDAPASPPAGKGGRRENSSAERGNSPVILGLNRLVKEEAPRGVKKVGGGGAAVEEGYGDEVGGDRRSRAAVENILRRSERGTEVTKGALVVRVFEVIACLISFSIMAADKTKGWSGDSFDRYREYRYCLVVNIIGFVYSGFQAYDLAYHLGTEKHVISHHLRYHFDFSMDQILAYLVMSASSSAATRVTDWITNWGKDDFTLMASASIAMSFLAFIAFATSSLISGYNLCNRDST
ncbi:CASP-like protein 4A3 [Salvia miltiorrhiza]|uniref:CASP-like protein 4A3 n=1 Tax=Salvia miltiorrhiza TaxID=226208 RepID=UPI0025ABE4CD|nr:CASP-like protein 4A3 [Salvia miltiorrhiza]